MADNHTLNTRIKLKYDSYENWIAKDPVLLAGEVAIATVASNDAEGKPGFQNLPNIVFKVGDGSSKYSALKFVSALAADVHSWAKAADKPVYTAAEIDGIQQYINDIIAGTENIQDTDTKYIMETVDGDAYKYGLYSTNKAGENKTLVYTLDLSGVDTRLDTLEAAIGESGKVSQQIAAAIDAIAVAETTLGTTEMYSGYKQVGGIVTLNKRTLGVANVDGLQAALDAKQDNLVFETAYDAATNKVATMANVTGAIDALDKVDAAVEKQFVTAVSEENGIITVSRAALKATDIPTIAQNQVDGLEDALDAKQDTLVIADGYNAESNKVATEATVTKAVADLNGAMHFEGVVEKDPSEFTAEENGAYSAGDVVLFGYDEYVYDGTAWHKLGNESIYKLKSEAATEHEAMQGEINGLKTSKQDALGFEGTYNKETNKVVTKSAMTDAITSAVDALDKADAAVEHQFVTAVSEENGIITVLRAQPAIADVNGLTERLTGIDGEIAKKQDAVTFADDYDKDTNKAATVATVTNAINALDKADAAVEGQFVTAVPQENGVVTVSRAAVTTDHIQQGAKTFVLDCGTATL